MKKVVFSICLGLSLLAPMQGAAMSLEEELKIGKEEHAKIIAQFGVYRDKDLQEYVDKVGQRVAKVFG